MTVSNRKLQHPPLPRIPRQRAMGRAKRNPSQRLSRVGGLRFRL